MDQKTSLAKYLNRNICTFSYKTDMVFSEHGVPQNTELFDGAVPPNSVLFGGNVPANRILILGFYQTQHDLGQANVPIDCLLHLNPNIPCLQYLKIIRS